MKIKKVERENKKLLETAINMANGYYIIEEEAHKIKTFDRIDGKFQAVEKIEIVPVKKYVPPNASVNTFLIKTRIAGYGDGQPDNIVEVLLDEDAKKYAK